MPMMKHAKSPMLKLPHVFFIGRVSAARTSRLTVSFLELCILFGIMSDKNSSLYPTARIYFKRLVGSSYLSSSCFSMVQPRM